MRLFLQPTNLMIKIKIIQQMAQTIQEIRIQNRL